MQQMMNVTASTNKDFDAQREAEHSSHVRTAHVIPTKLPNKPYELYFHSGKS
jgi:hypothetical protein